MRTASLSSQLARLDAVQTKLQKVFSPFAARALTGTNAVALSSSIGEVFDSEYAVSNIRQTLLQLLRPVITEAWIAFIARQFAARRSELVTGPIMIFAQLSLAEWLHVEIVQAEDSAWKDNKPGIKLSMYVLDGRPAGYVLRRNFPAGWITGKAYEMGFSRAKVYDYEPSSLVGLRSYVHAIIDPRTSEPSFDEWTMPKPLKAYNKTVIAKRMRFDSPPRNGDELCPFEFNHSCNECMKTYAQCHASYIRTVS